MRVFSGQKGVPPALNAHLRLKEQTIARLQQQIQKLSHFQTDERNLQEQVAHLQKAWRQNSLAIDNQQNDEVALKSKLESVQRNIAKETSSLESTIQRNIIERGKVEGSIARLEEKLKEQANISSEMSIALNESLVKKSKQMTAHNLTKDDKQILIDDKRNLVRQCQVLQGQLDREVKENIAVAEEQEGFQKRRQILQGRLVFLESAQQEARLKQKKVLEIYSTYNEKKRVLDSHLQESKGQRKALKDTSLQPSATKDLKEKVRTLAQTNCSTLARIRYADHCASEVSSQISCQQDSLVNSNSRKADLAQLNHVLKGKIADQKIESNLLNERYLRIRESYNKSKECERALRRILEERSCNEQSQE